MIGTSDAPQNAEATATTREGCSMSNRKAERTTSKGTLGADLGPDIAHDYRRKVGQWVKEMRINLEMTQTDLADRARMKPNGISAIETGRNSIPPEAYADFANAFDIGHRTFGKIMVRYSNPWAYELIYGVDETLQQDIAELSKRPARPAGPKGSN
jgi:transcriptional regulator with XRE-family HTH domain